MLITRTCQNIKNVTLMRVRRPSTALLAQQWDGNNSAEQHPTVKRVMEGETLLVHRYSLWRVFMCYSPLVLTVVHILFFSAPRCAHSLLLCSSLCTHLSSLLLTVVHTPLLPPAHRCAHSLLSSVIPGRLKQELFPGG